jgi:diguanylate cyclase (GGDEF)-like protein
MGIRTKSVALLGVTAAVLWIVLFGAGLAVGGRTADQIDRHRVTQALDGAKAAIRHGQTNLVSISGDWAAWDDTYRFVKDLNPTYVKANLGDQALVTLGVDFMVFMDRSGRIVYSRSVDPRTHSATPLPAGLVAYLASRPTLLRGLGPAAPRAGALALPEGPFAVAAQAIVTSDLKSPPDGVFVTGYRLDGDKLAALRRETLMLIDVYSPTARGLPAAASTALEALSGGAPSVVAARDATLSAYALVTGVDDKPAFLVGVAQPRVASTATRQAIIEGGTMLGLFGLVLVVTLGMVLDRTVMKRLSLLSSSVDEIARTADVDARLTVSGSDEIARLTGGINDMLDDLGRSHSELEYLDVHDPLTGLSNRAHFEAELSRELAEGRSLGDSGAVLWLDLDQFRDINDSLGHAAGDQLLVGVASALKARTRSYWTLARLGGDQFGLILPHADRGEAVDAAERLLDDVRSTAFVAGDHDVRVSASIGAVLYPEQGTDESEVLARADLAMHDAKAKGGNQLAVSQPDDTWRDDMTRSLETAETILAALRDDRFVLYGQPLYDLKGSGAEAYELLLRMVDDDGKIVVPDRFIPTAERLGLIADIDHWVMVEGIRLLAEWQAAGRDVRFSVNLSGRAFSNPAVIDMIRDELAATGCDPRGLTIEITETTVVADIEGARKFMRSLKGLGCRFSLDDFGSGASSFYYLKHLPIDTLKIDGSLVRGLATTSQDKHFVRAIVEMCKSLHIKTVAEYVEDEKILNEVRRLGVDLAQGYHVGRPEPLEAYFASAMSSGQRGRPERTVARSRADAAA